MIKNISNKILMTFIIFLITFATLISYKTYAATISETYVTNDKDFEGNKQIPLEDLSSFWYYLCCQHRQHLPSKSKVDEAKNEYSGYSKTLASPTESIHYGKEYESEEVAYYYVKDNIVCNPKEAYILNQVTPGNTSYGSGSNYTEIQRAWWSTKQNDGEKIAENTLAKTASAYMNFVATIAENPADVTEPDNYETLTHTYEDGSNVSIKFPKIKKELSDSSVLSFDSKNVKVNFNKKTQKYDIGPFVLNYAGGSANGVDFGTIDGFDIYTDASTDPVSSDKWRFVYTSDHNSEKQYPDSKEPFYIELDYIENATRITGIDVDYKYLIMGAEYQKLLGNYDKYVWKLKSVDNSYIDSTTGEKVSKYNCTLVARNQNLALESQELGYFNKAAKWYEKTKIHLTTNQGDLKVKKVALDENGNELNAEQIKEIFGEYQYFNFEIKVMYSDGGYQEITVPVKAGGEEFNVGTFLWTDDEDAPKYEVKEITDKMSTSWSYVSIENEKGTVSKNTTITAVGKNKLNRKPKSDDIEITKKIDEPSDRDELFKFNVKVTYPNEKVDERIAEILVEAGQTKSDIWKASEHGGKYEWYGDKDATYEINEIEIPAGYTLASITPQKGILDGNNSTAEAKVTAQNNNTMKKGKVSVVKKLSKPAEKTETFNVVVDISEVVGREQTKTYNVPLTIEAGKIESNVWTSPEYKWLTDEQVPKYKITENLTEEQKQKYSVKIDNAEGTLNDKAIVPITVTNTLNRRFIELKKVMTEPATEDKVINFTVKVTEDGKEPEVLQGSVTVKAGETESETWNSKTYTWGDKQKAPTYEVTENIPDEEKGLYKTVITPDKGSFDDVDSENIHVTMVNTTQPKPNSKSNTIAITKTISNPAEKDELFKFEVSVTYEDGTKDVSEAEIKVPQGQVTGNTWTSKAYTWEENQTAPKYEIKEIETEDSKKYTPVITPSTGSLNGDVAQINVNALNNQHRIKITKVTSSEAEKDELFKFKVTVKFPDGTKDNVQTAEIKVPQGKTTGDTWVSSSYVWDATKGDATYEVEELETEDSKKYKPTITPSTGKLSQDTIDVNVLAENNLNKHEGTIKITKELVEGQVTDQVFTFDVKVDGAQESNETFKVNLKAGETSQEFKYHWLGDAAPRFTISETDNSEVKGANIEVSGGKNIKKSGKTVEGTLSDDEKSTEVTVKFINQMQEHSSKITVNKEFFTTEKMTSDEIKAALKGKVSFTAKVIIEGTFKYKNNMYENTSLVITDTLSSDNNWSFTTDSVYWYGESIPTYKVEEILPNSGWKLRSTKYSDLENVATDTDGHQLVDSKTVTVTLVNESDNQTIDLTFSMAGIVWVDNEIDNKNDVNNDLYFTGSNGVFDAGYDTLKENAEVIVYRVIYDQSGNEVSREIAKAYKDIQNNEVQFPIVTVSDGAWNVARMPVPAFTEAEKARGYTVENNYSVTYDVEFAYDGQTYEPVEFLSYKVSDMGKDGYNKEYENCYAKKINGSTVDRAREYINANRTEKAEYAKDSMALEVSNNSNKITEISGKTAINGNGDTTGVVSLNDGSTQDITYSSDDAGVAYPTHSKLNTLKDDGRVLDVFKATARTSAGNLTFPFDVDGYDGTSLISENTTISEYGIEKSYQFFAVYNYCLNINLGLKERPDADLVLSKKLDNAKVVVKEKLYQYNYSGFYDLTEEKTESLNKCIEGGNDKSAELQLGLYKSDYYYRAELYEASKDNTVYDALTNFYVSLGKTLDDTEMDIYLTYKIKVYNASSDYDIKVNSIDDYYDSTYALITSDETKYLKSQTKGGKQTEVNDTVKVASASTVDGSKVNWSVVDTNIVGSDKDANGSNIVYNKMTAKDLGLTIPANSDKEITVTFKATKKYVHDVADAIELGQKCNVAEIASYSTYYAGKKENAGKIDRDSAPGNVNIKDNNTKSWYEDDTFAAPVLRITLKDDEVDRKVQGIVWEDDSTKNNLDNPQYNQTVGDGIKQSGEEVISGLDTELVEKLLIQDTENGKKTDKYTEYDFTWPTNVPLTALGGRTIEELTGFDSTIETNNAGEYNFNSVAAGDYVVRFTYGNKLIKTADYSEDVEYYNGQDFKSTQFKAELKNNKTELTADSYLDIEKLNNSESQNNVAVDNEVRRMEVISNSREITYSKSAVLASSAKTLKGYSDNELDSLRSELLEKYYMFAETPKLDMNIELSNYGTDKYSYTVKNVNCGIEERPQTRITLDKQIEEILLTTSDGRTIMDAKYNISYDNIDDKGNITATVELDKENSFGTENLQALNRDYATNQGFRYINVDSTILEGTTITAKYKFTVLNTGEVDRTGKLSSYDLNINEACEDLSARLAKNYTKSSDNMLVNNTKLGDYVGSIYYYGSNGSKDDAIVTTTVRQLVDYVDNDVTFSGLLNAEPNTSWANISVDELKSMIKNSIFTTLEDGTVTVVDSNNVRYENENKSNLIASVDNANAENGINNAGFIIELVPQNTVVNGVNGNYQSSMNLTTTRYVGSDSDDLQIDNIAEIIKYTNTVGRRDQLSISGNQNPAEIEKDYNLMTNNTLSAGMTYERDTSATEVITLSPPTGAELSMWKLQVIAASTLGLIIIAGGIVLIKKKVLK